MRNCYENDPRKTRKTREKNKKNQCNLCNLWTIFFIIRVNSCNSWGENCMAKTLAVIGSNTPFLFVSGIVDRFGCFDIDVPNPPYVRNTVGAHNAGVVIGYLLVNFDNLYGQ
jgi:hypothetical protein